MKKLIFLLPVIFLAFLIPSLRQNTGNVKSRTAYASDAISCAPEATAEIFPGSDGKFITVLPGVGTHGYPISTGVDSAQVYFNQGISMYYSYHAREAVASFRESAKFDSSSAMTWWGQALAMGPSFNFGHLFKLKPELKNVLSNMNSYSSAATDKEKDLISAMNFRYDMNDLTDKQRPELNRKYAAAMKELVLKYPEDIDIRALYTDAIMIIHPWEFWFNDGRPKPWTPELVENCKQILKQNPRHPGGLHYYIHVTEASREPHVALSSADSLLKLFPGIAHMVHMSSHEYERLGYYAKGVDANEKADRALVVYDSLAKGLFQAVHVPHYYSVDAYCAISGAMYDKSWSKSIVLRKSVEPEDDKIALQALYMFPTFALVRMGRWDDILNDTTTLKPGWSYAWTIDDFAKGMAYVKKGNMQEALKKLNSLKERKKDTILNQRFSPYFSKGIQVIDVAENVLHSSFLFKQEKYSAAIKTMKQAILAEDSIIYSEPKMWMIPARQYLGMFYMQLRQFSNAEKTYREDLVWNPGNGWSVIGLMNALKAQKKMKEIPMLSLIAKRAFSKAEKMPAVSAY